MFYQHKRGRIRTLARRKTRSPVPWAAVGVAGALLAATMVAGTSAQPPDGHPWRTVLGSFERVADLDVLDTGQVVGTGSNALIKLRDGVWVAVDLPVEDQHYRSIELSATETGWAVGSEVATRIDNATVVEQTQLPGYYMSDLWLESDTSGWAIGTIADSDRAGAVFRLRDGTWSPHFSLTDSGTVLHGLWMDHASRGWAVGDRGTVLEWDGDTWAPMTPPTSYALQSVIHAPNGTLIVGGGTSHGPNGRGGQSVILEWDGSTWTQKLHASAASIVALEVAGDDVLALSAGGQVYRRSGDRWQETHASFYADYTRPTTSLVVLDQGHGYVATADGAIYALDLTAERFAWSKTLGPAFDLAFTSDDVGWIVGQTGFPQVLSNGALRDEQDRVLADAMTIESRPSREGSDLPDEAWAAGRDGMVFEYREGTWLRHLVHPGVDFYRLRIIGDEVWVLGARDASVRSPRHPFVLRRHDDRGWITIWQQENDSNLVVHDFDVDPAGRVLLATNAGVLEVSALGARPSPLRLPTYSIEFGQGYAWAGGAGAIYRLEPSCWVEQELSISDRVTDLWLDPDGQGWAAATSGYVLHQNDSGWHALRGLSDRTSRAAIPNEWLGLEVVESESAQQLWLAGSKGSVAVANIEDVRSLPTVEIAATVAPPAIPTSIFTPRPAPDRSGQCAWITGAHLPYVTTSR